LGQKSYYIRSFFCVSFSSYHNYALCTLHCALSNLERSEKLEFTVELWHLICYTGGKEVIP